jgi:hypothetical protein
MTTGKIAGYIALSLLAGIAVPTTIQAAAVQKETFRDWSASLNEENTGEDLRKTCGAMTTATIDGQGWTLFVEISNGDVLPPDGYPQIAIVAATGGVTTAKNQPATFSFDDKNIEAAFSSDGSEVMVNNVKETSLALFKAFAAGDKVDVTLAGKHAASFSLKGFTAAYRHLGTWCSFKTDDVAK